MNLSTPQVIVIFGPTASGKSALAVELAERLGGEIINADSRQVYAGMPIMSACPSVEDYARVPHHLFEFLNVRERFSAGRWAELAEEKIGEIVARGHVPIVVGGTGFYLRALMDGMSEIPEIPEAVEREFEEIPTSTLYADLLGFDPVLAQKLMPGDRQRILRGVVVYRYTKKILSDWQKGVKCGADFRFLKIGLKINRAVLHTCIAERWKSMVERGVLDEIRALKEAGYTTRDAALGGLAIPDFFAHLDGKMTLEEVLERAIPRDRQYAKRQYTWLNNSFGADRVFETVDVQAVAAFVLSA